MENASKALIIAGAILLSILIIALGIYVFNMAKNASSTSSLDELQVSQYNQQFTNYRGKQLGSGVIDLLDKVVANASANKDAEERLPDIIYLDSRKGSKLSGGAEIKDGADNAVKAVGMTVPGSDTSSCWITSTTSNTNISNIGAVRNKIAEKHYYRVEMVNNNTTGFVEYIIINYDTTEKTTP